MTNSKSPHPSELLQMTTNHPPEAARWRGQEMQGFNDATEYLLDRRPDSVELFNEYHKPPPGIPQCSGCVATTVQTNDCPACQYELGFADGSSK